MSNSDVARFLPTAPKPCLLGRPAASTAPQIMSAPKRKKPSSPEQESKLPEKFRFLSCVFGTSNFLYTPVADKIDIGFAKMNSSIAELKESICNLHRGDDLNSSFDLQREINSNFELQSKIKELQDKIVDLKSECETSRQMIIDQDNEIAILRSEAKTSLSQVNSSLEFAPECPSKFVESESDNNIEVDLEIETEKLKSQISNMKCERARMGQEISKLRKQISEFESRPVASLPMGPEPKPKTVPMHPDRKLEMEKNKSGRVKKHDLTENRRIMKEGILKSFPQLKNLNSMNVKIFSKRHSIILSSGYERILLGDHGPYLEVKESTLYRPNLIAGGVSEKGHYRMMKSRDGVRLYAQLKPVHAPNPPESDRPGPFACNMNREGGYADYRKGMIYIPLSSVRLCFDDNIHRQLDVNAIVQRLEKLECYVGKSFKSWNTGSNSRHSNRRRNLYSIFDL